MEMMAMARWIRRVLVNVLCYQICAARSTLAIAIISIRYPHHLPIEKRADAMKKTAYRFNQ